MRASLIVAMLFIFASCTKNSDDPAGTGGDIPGATHPIGTIKGKFSVSSDRQVYFSQGNLQYKASNHTWKFADYQWDYIGYGNENISYSYTGWIDLFGWGTSNNPTNTSGNNGDYGVYAEWGYNKISNGGNEENMWRTLTIGEWDYIINNRTTTSSIRYARACVNNTNGIILVPDDWNESYYSLNNVNHDGEYMLNTISDNDWINSCEAHGAVFLPAAGARGDDGMTSLSHVNTGGYYWSSTVGGLYTARRLYFSTNSMIFNDRNRFFGGSVRLVCTTD